ncbi:MAG TPA: hypothetical protein IAB65_04420 [Candidatus Onthocola stercorigallinarum]|nr:hypothetical protein [Candidatus Onthocola stercorigallinarum]
MSKWNFIDDSIVFDEESLPNDIKEDIKSLKKYDKENDFIMYNACYEGIETGTKNLLISGRITEEQYRGIERKYGGYV